LFLEPMTADVADLHRLANRHAVIDEREAAVACAWIVPARFVVAVRKFDEGDVLAQCHRFGRWCDAGDCTREETATTSPAAGAATGRSANRGRTLLRTAATAAASTRGFIRERERH